MSKICVALIEDMSLVWALDSLQQRQEIEVVGEAAMPMKD